MVVKVAEEVLEASWLTSVVANLDLFAVRSETRLLVVGLKRYTKMGAPADLRGNRAASARLD